ncbi:ferredoxin [Brasilonema octagenarum UFV-E1]|uniref:Ferredoxin n=2 Tax=Brasilonema TaxID=383614 RepID=A0A856MN42_9CYAN|nr:ferredoxin [Brasilonema octagenarum UFV-OR1]QDL11922.1 ferredoxin [Brasilonema sennae CENA114]QDL18296.1 ferredoxin [Brasilonema octagenarum UFV-E1]
MQSWEIDIEQLSGSRHLSNTTVIQSCLQLRKTTLTPANKALSISIEALELSKIPRDLLTSFVPIVSNCFCEQARLPFWEGLKKRLKQLSLHKRQDGNFSCIFGNKINCLPVCCSRLIIKDYPDAVRYRPTIPEAIERIIQEHFLGNKVVEEYALCFPILCQKVP